jgi:hypothetical protein
MNPWLFLPIGYVFTILIETPVLLVGLSKRHALSRRLFAGAWLTLCTYPIVVLVLPVLMQANESDGHWIAYLVVAETFAPVAECLLFWAAFDMGGATLSGTPAGRREPHRVNQAPPHSQPGASDTPQERGAGLSPPDPVVAPADPEPAATRGELARDMAAIVVANLASFGLGEVIKPLFFPG